MWTIKFTKQASKDKELLKQSGLDKKAIRILTQMMIDPFIVPPSFEKLIGTLEGYYLRRINIQHRIVYKVYKDLNTIVVHSMWTHYEK